MRFSPRLKHPEPVLALQNVRAQKNHRNRFGWLLHEGDLVVGANGVEPLTYAL